jgi:HTH-type transcriptional regulator / antitoxin HigA
MGNGDMQYQPDFVTPPGESLEEILETIGMSQVNLARRMGRPIKTINEIIKGKAGITPETALQLELVLDTPASFWINREKRYRESLAREEERLKLEEHIQWLKNFPIKEMIRFGWIDKFSQDTDQLREILNFFGVVSPAQWAELWTQPDAAFRTSSTFEADPFAVTAWLRKGELEAQNISCAPYDKNRFLNSLNEIRSLTNDGPGTFVPQIQRICASAGVATVFTRELPKSRASGATRWLNPNKALIQLSLRYKTNDHLWFTFFHEAGHIVLHGKKEVFLEGGDTEKNQKEEQADEFARNLLIPPHEYAKLQPTYENFSHADIEMYAKQVGVAPGVIVGRLQHDGKIPPSHLNKLKQRLAWAE